MQKLPNQNKCINCKWSEKCKKLFGNDDSNDYCQFTPSRFDEEKLPKDRFYREGYRYFDRDPAKAWWIQWRARERWEAEPTLPYFKKESAFMDRVWRFIVIFPMKLNQLSLIERKGIPWSVGTSK